MPRMPQVTARELVRFLKSQGFVEDRQTGSHLRLWQPQRQVLLIVPMHFGSDVPRGLALKILKDAGFSVDDYLRLR